MRVALKRVSLSSSRALRGAWRRNTLAVAVVALVAAAFLPYTASAQTVADPDYWKQTAERRDVVHRFFYAQSPQTIPSTYDPVAEAEAILRNRQATLPPTNPQAPSLWQRIRDVTTKVRLAPALSTLSLLSLAAETGWMIGTGPVAKFLKIGQADTPSEDGYFRGYWAEWLPAGTAIIHGGEAPVDAFYLTAENAQGSWQNGFLRANPAQGGACATNYDIPDSIGWTDVVTAHSACFQGWGEPYGYREVHAYYRKAEDWPAGGPIEDYAGQQYDVSTPAPPVPEQSTVEQAIETELEKPENALLRQWLNYRLGSPGEEDPLGTGPPNPHIPWETFEELIEHWDDHKDEFPEYDDEWEYWQGAVDIIQAGDQGGQGVQKCVRSHDNATIYYKPSTGEVVIVRGGRIQTYLIPDDPFDFWNTNCD